MRSENEPQENREDVSAESIVKLVARVLIPIILLGSGLYLLHLRLSGWSLIFGLPMTVISSVILIFTYDEVVSKRMSSCEPKFTLFESKKVRCSVCGKETPRVKGEWEEDTICPKCQSLKEKKI